jgi:hypothetical protein
MHCANTARALASACVCLPLPTRNKTGKGGRVRGDLIHKKVALKMKKKKCIGSGTANETSSLREARHQPPKCLHCAIDVRTVRIARHRCRLHLSTPLVHLRRQIDPLAVTADTPRRA